MNELKHQIDDGHFPLLPEVKNSHSIAGLIKWFIRNVPQPLLTYPLYPKFIEVTKLNSAQEQVSIIYARLIYIL